MTRRTLILSSLRYHLRAHLGTLLGAAVVSTVLIGALVVGDSVRHTLGLQAMERLRNVQVAVVLHDRFFRSELANEIVEDLGDKLVCAPVLRLTAAAKPKDEKNPNRANRVRVLGVDPRFHQLSAAPQPEGEFGEGFDSINGFINQRLADQLNAKVGDAVRLYLAKPTVLPRDVPLAVEDRLTVTIDLKVTKILKPADGSLANFSLRADSVPPFNVFVPLPVLQKTAKQDGRANLLLVGGGGIDPTLLQAANDSLSKHWQLDDAELELRALEKQGVFELRSRRIFMDALTLQTAQQAGEANGGSQVLLSYIVNRITRGDGLTPYSIVTAISDPPAISDSIPRPISRPIKPGEIIITDWLEGDLANETNATIGLRYFILGDSREMGEADATATYAGNVSLAKFQNKGIDREMMPAFPGIKKIRGLGDLGKLGFDVDAKLIDEHPTADEYWDGYRGTPKAFISLEYGQSLWKNPYGKATAVRYPFIIGGKEKIESAFHDHFLPASIGLIFSPVREEALASSRAATPFGVLFLGLSFFLVAAALVLMALFFVFGVEQRTTEYGTLLAMGFGGRTVRNIVLAEGAALALVGTLLGACGGLAYTRHLIHRLNYTDWSDAIAGVTLSYNMEPLTVGLGMIAALGVAIMTLWLTVCRLRRARVTELLSGNFLHTPFNGQTGKRSTVIGIVCVAAAVSASLWMGGLQGMMKAIGFFCAGSLLLIAILCFCHALIGRMAAAGGGSFANLGEMARRASARRRGRSLACVCLLACGVFLVIAIGAFRVDAKLNANERWSGTGGFAFWATTDVPVLFDPNTKRGRFDLTLDEKDLPSGTIVPLRVRPGDDASCLNLNQVLQPRLLGVDPALMKGRFTFMGSDQNWALLAQTDKDGSLPAIVDMNTAMWALKKSVGDTLDYTDERGRVFKIRIAGLLENSMLQGDLLVNARHLKEKYPSISGYQAFFMDLPPGKTDEELTATLSEALSKHGLEMNSAQRRLEDFSLVQNTYIAIFQTLGGLALLLGSVGLGIVVLRNVLERRGELALMQAVGFGRGRLRWMVATEHGLLLVLGLVGGLAAAALAVWPQMSASPAEWPRLRELAGTVGLILASGMLWTWLAATIALRGKLLPALRGE